MIPHTATRAVFQWYQTSTSLNVGVRIHFRQMDKWIFNSSRVCKHLADMRFQNVTHDVISLSLQKSLGVALLNSIVCSMFLLCNRDVILGSVSALRYYNDSFTPLHSLLLIHSLNENGTSTAYLTVYQPIHNSSNFTDVCNPCHCWCCWLQ